MKFIEKLIEDTRNGKLDFVWKYNDGAKTYSYVKAKDPMNSMFIDANRKTTSIIFSNGVEVTNYDRNQLNMLLDEIVISQKRTVDTIISNYINNVGNPIQSDGSDTTTDDVNSDGHDNTSQIDATSLGQPSSEDEIVKGKNIAKESK
jgi:hypothetical protein